METPPSAQPVMAVFSGTGVEPQLFERAVREATARRASLLLLDVRHERQADRLQDFLSGDSFLPGGVLKRLRQAVKEQRDRAVQRALDALAETAREQGLDVETLEIKGAYTETVLAVVQQRGVGVAVVDRHAPVVTALGERCTVIEV